MKNISKKAKTLWIIRRTLGTVFFIAALVVAVALLLANDPTLALVGTILTIVFGFIDILWLFYAYIFPNFEYKNYQYKLTETELYVKHGVIFKTSFVIPFVQIQDICSHQGPFEQLFKIKRIELSTAGSNHDLEGLDNETADEMIMIIKDAVNNLVKREQGIE